MGFSTTRYEADASPRASITRKQRMPNVGSGKSAAPRTRTGQCHRYQEYDNRPNSWNGQRLSMRTIALFFVLDAARKIAIVENTGSSAATPGNAIVLVNR